MRTPIETSRPVCQSLGSRSRETHRWNGWDVEGSLCFRLHKQWAEERLYLGKMCEIETGKTGSYVLLTKSVPQVSVKQTESEGGQGVLGTVGSASHG